jgi:hypothetical protein
MGYSTEILADLIQTNDEHLVQSPGWYEELKVAVNDLINHDFNKLIQLLYQLDVPEQKLKNIFSANTGEDAGTIITNLLVERQIQRIKSKKNNQSKPSDIPDEERW